MIPETYITKPSSKSLEVGEVCDWNISDQQEAKKAYTYDEAIDLAGNGWYIYALIVVLAVALEGMALDIFGLSVIVHSACDMKLTHDQEKILLSMPFLGSIIMAYPWGYIADTQGRLKGLKISLWGSFILASLSAFSPHWIVLAALRFWGTSLSSGIHSLSLTLLGESSSSRLKGPSLIGVTTLLYFTFGIYSVCAHLILKFEFAYDLGFIVFTPWRLLTLVLALPLGTSAVLLFFFLESPKFLLNIGDENNALRVLREISKRNGVKINKYPVQKVLLNETTTVQKDIPLLQSLMDQIFPLFKPPLLYRTIQLFSITAVVFSSNNGFYSWLPLVADRLNTGFDNNTTSSNLCGMISTYKKSNSDTTCIATVTEFTVWISLIQGVAYSILNFVVSWLSDRKKLVLISLLLICVVCGCLIPIASGMILSITLFYGLLFNGICVSIIFSYYVNIFPTSYRGMAACLGVMVARISAVFGTNIVGSYIVSHCAASFYGWSLFIICAVIAAIFLPPDKPKTLN